MDAVAFLKAAERRSKSNPDYYGEFINLHDNDWVALVAQVEQWAKDHPRKTRQSEFLKMFPDTIMDDYGIIGVHPCELDKAHYGMPECGCRCTDCHKRYWLEEIG